MRRLAVRARFGDVRRVVPLTKWGTQRGLPVDRWYIELYLRGRAEVVMGRVLEVKEDAYASELGASHVEVVDIDPSNELATIVGDLCDPRTLAPGRYDAVILTETLQLVADPHAALQNIFRSLKAGGSVLITVPCLSRLAGSADRWRWTPNGFEQQLRAALTQPAEIEVLGLGNGLTGRAFLFGLAADDLPRDALEVHDPDLPLVVAAFVRVP